MYYQEVYQFFLWEKVLILFPDAIGYHFARFHQHVSNGIKVMCVQGNSKQIQKYIFLTSILIIT